jgi:predicted enzyme related to lactoylglutathione lyase
MPNFSFVVLYVENPPASAAFYAELLGRPVVDSAPGFAMLPLSDAVMLGLWSHHDVKPPSVAPAGGSEVAFTVADADAVQAMFADWQQRGLTILQPPVHLDFGHTFTAADPDGHRLRVFAPAAA